ncbi:hypothetical protein CU097_000827, partial [Rhizopus azygosporus]
LYSNDTVLNSFRSLDTKPKLDLSILSSAKASLPDAWLREFAGQRTAEKMYLDKLKLVLIIKLQLNYYKKHLEQEVCITKDDCIEELINVVSFTKDHVLKLKRQMNDLEWDEIINKITKVLSPQSTATTVAKVWCSDVI